MSECGTTFGTMRCFLPSGHAGPHAGKTWNAVASWIEGANE